MKFEIYFSDLIPDAQKRYLEALCINSPEDENLDLIPIAEIECEEDDDISEEDIDEDEISKSCEDFEDGDSGDNNI